MDRHVCDFPLPQPVHFCAAFKMLPGTLAHLEVAIGSQPTAEFTETIVVHSASTDPNLSPEYASALATWSVPDDGQWHHSCVEIDAKTQFLRWNKWRKASSDGKIRFFLMGIEAARHHAFAASRADERAAWGSDLHGGGQNFSFFVDNLHAYVQRGLPLERNFYHVDTTDHFPSGVPWGKGFSPFGWKGGKCRCPDGNVYLVADGGRGCGPWYGQPGQSSALTMDTCHGGVLEGECSDCAGPWSHR